LAGEQLFERLVLEFRLNKISSQNLIVEKKRGDQSSRVVALSFDPYPVSGMTFTLSRLYTPVAALIFLSVLLLSCDRQTGAIQKNENNSRLAGTWVIQSRIIDGVESPADQRFIGFVFNADGLFSSKYRGEKSQGWIRAGEGAFSYNPPVLTLYWDSGAIATLLVVESGPERLVFHHGRNLAPLLNQEPDEVFARQKPEKGPIRKPS